MGTLHKTCVLVIQLQAVAKSLAGKKLVQFNASDNAFGPRGLVACKPALLPCLDTLERAYFCNNGLSEHAGADRAIHSNQ